MKSRFPDPPTTNETAASKSHFRDTRYLELGEKRDGSQDLGTFSTIRAGSESESEGGRRAPLVGNGAPFGGGIVKSVDMRHESSYRSKSSVK